VSASPAAVGGLLLCDCTVSLLSKAVSAPVITSVRGDDENCFIGYNATNPDESPAKHRH
jgi:hypothetical protein